MEDFDLIVTNAFQYNHKTPSEWIYRRAQSVCKLLHIPLIVFFWDFFHTQSRRKKLVRNMLGREKLVLAIVTDICGKSDLVFYGMESEWPAKESEG